MKKILVFLIISALIFSISACKKNPSVPSVETPSQTSATITPTISITLTLTSSMTATSTPTVTPYACGYGHTTDISGAGVWTAGYITLSPLTITASMTVDSVDIRTKLSGNIAAFIYSGNGGNPDALITRSAVIAVSTPGWINITITATTLNPGTSYWYGAVSDTDSIANGGVGSSYESCRYYNVSWTAGNINLPPPGSTWTPFITSNQIYLNGMCTP